MLEFDENDPLRSYERLQAAARVLTNQRDTARAEVARLEAVSAGQRAIINELLVEDVGSVSYDPLQSEFFCRVCGQMSRNQIYISLVHTAACIITRARAVDEASAGDESGSD